MVARKKSVDEKLDGVLGLLRGAYLHKPLVVHLEDANTLGSESNVSTSAIKACSPHVKLNECPNGRYAFWLIGA
jgi:hypothetical protein